MNVIGIQTGFYYLSEHFQGKSPTPLITVVSHPLFPMGRSDLFKDFLLGDGGVIQGICLFKNGIYYTDHRGNGTGGFVILFDMVVEQGFL